MPLTNKVSLTVRVNDALVCCFMTSNGTGVLPLIKDRSVCSTLDPPLVLEHQHCML